MRSSHWTFILFTLFIYSLFKVDLHLACKKPVNVNNNTAYICINELPSNIDKKKSVTNFFFPELWSLNCPKWCIFCKFVLTSAGNLNILKQFISIHLKDLIMLFQKIVFFYRGPRY